MWGIISSVLITASFIISKSWLNGEYLGEMVVVSILMPLIIHIFNKIKNIYRG